MPILFSRNYRETSSPQRRLRLLLSILALTIIGSSLGYLILDPRQEANLIDAFYMTFITIATVGYKEVYPLTQGGKLFTIAVIAFSAVTLVYTIGTLGQFFMEGELREILGRRKMDKRITKMKDHYIIAGHGRVGEIVQEEFDKAGVPYIVIESVPERLTELEKRGNTFIEGNATEDEVLLDTGIKHAKYLVSTIPSEADSVFIALTARQLNPDIFIIARADSKTAEKKVLRAGADRVVMPHDTGGRRMALASLKPNLVDSLSIDSFGGELGLEIEEVEIPASCSFAGKSLLDSQLRSKHGVTVLAIRKASGQKKVNPPPDTIIEAGDVLILVGEKESIRGLGTWRRRSAEPLEAKSMAVSIDILATENFYFAFE